MGWSYSAAASDTLDWITKHYSAGDGSSNTIMVDGMWGFFEETRRDQPGGAICGSVRRALKQSERDYWKGRGVEVSENSVVKAGSFKIDGSGKIVRFPGLPVKEINKKLGFV